MLAERQAQEVADASDEAEAVAQAPAIPVGDPDPDAAEEELSGVARSASIISVCVVLSRITGFVRTWSMAFALGATFLSSSYQVANNLPNQLYELVMGGMLVTAFLPVYMQVKKKAGKRASDEYASNLFTLVILFLGVVAALCMIFPQAIVYTQSFMTDQSDMGIAVLLFQFFAIQTVFYGASTILSGLLNANREYLWSSAAPIFNNLIVIATFIAYAVVAPASPETALYIIAVGNPAGVLLQVLVQIPALRRCGVRLRLKISFSDPWIRETLKLGASALVITAFTFITVSVMNAASYVFADNGPSVIAYARLWYTLPYSFLAIPITTALFTELSDMHNSEDDEGVVRCILSGSRQILFLLGPFMLYLIVFAEPLVTLYHTGAFTEDKIGQIAQFLAALAVALPFYGLVTFFQKVFSSIRRLGVFAWFNVIASLFQVALTLGGVLAFRQGYPVTLESVAWASVAFYIATDLLCVIYLKAKFRSLELLPMLSSFILGLMLGALGAAGGGAVLFAMKLVFGAQMANIGVALLCVIGGGIVALALTFGMACALKRPEAALIRSLLSGLQRRRG